MSTGREELADLFLSNETFWDSSGMIPAEDCADIILKAGFVRMPDELWDAVQAKAAAEGTNASEVVRRLLTEWMGK